MKDEDLCNLLLRQQGPAGEVEVRREAAERIAQLKAQTAAHYAGQLEPQDAKAVAPDGWVLVPVTPTLNMEIAFAEQWYSKRRAIDDCEMSDCYAAMLAAAPQEPAQPMTDCSSVTVEVDANTVLTISNQHVSGIPDIEVHADVIRMAAQNLLGFIGKSHQEPAQADAQAESEMIGYVSGTNEDPSGKMPVWYVDPHSFPIGTKFYTRPADSTKFERVANYKVGRWFKARNIDEMQAFYLSRLPAIREVARQHGYAIGVHGSTRRDFDLIAMQWTDECSSPNALAHAIAKATCGITRDAPYEWEKKPQGRYATSIPVCWTDHSDRFPKDMLGLGHIDLSMMSIGDSTSSRQAGYLEGLEEAILKLQELRHPDGKNCECHDWTAAVYDCEDAIRAQKAEVGNG